MEPDRQMERTKTCRPYPAASTLTHTQLKTRQPQPSRTPEPRRRGEAREERALRGESGLARLQPAPQHGELLAKAPGGGEARSSGKEVGIRVPFFVLPFFRSILVGENLPQKRGEQGHLAEGPRRGGTAPKTYGFLKMEFLLVGIQTEEGQAFLGMVF